jgi:methionyl-tRNA formyltransferase
MSKGLCVSFGKIFSEAFLKNNNKIFNIHLSLLPSYRGPSPVENSILNGETTVGYTIFQIDNKIDTGNIVFQESFKIDNDTYASSFYENVSN